MIFTVRFDRLYGYKRTYRNVYIVRLENDKIIRIRDICFHEGNIFNGRDKKKALLKVVFDKNVDEELIFGKIRFRTTFDSGIEMPVSRIPRTLQLVSINQKLPTVKKPL